MVRQMDTWDGEGNKVAFSFPAINAPSLFSSFTSFVIPRLQLLMAYEMKDELRVEMCKPLPGSLICCHLHDIHMVTCCFVSCSVIKSSALSFPACEHRIMSVDMKSDKPQVA